jgi:prophage maintenance system killer protein
MSEVNLVSIEEIVEMHDQWIERLGGSPGIWAPNVLLYAYEVQLSPYYETLFEKAANQTFLLKRKVPLIHNPPPPLY